MTTIEEEFHEELKESRYDLVKWAEDVRAKRLKENQTDLPPERLAEMIFTMRRFSTKYVQDAIFDEIQGALGSVDKESKAYELLFNFLIMRNPYAMEQLPLLPRGHGNETIKWDGYEICFFVRGWDWIDFKYVDYLKDLETGETWSQYP